jgi:glutathione peroxidase
MENIYSIEVSNIDGKKVLLSEFEGKVLLIVNVASKCGFTPQYKGLQTIYEKYKDKGFVVLGFPCNQFGAQEPGNEDEIKNFCEVNYNVNFPMFSKVDVNGENTHPLYKFIKPLAPGVMGTEAIKWNFTKFLIGKDGKVLERFAPTTTPENLAPKIEEALN